MVFNSFQFLWLFPLIFFGYYLLSYILSKGNPVRQRKVSNGLLLLVSYGLYAQANMAFTLILLGVTAITYIFGLLIERDASPGKKIVFAGGDFGAVAFAGFQVLQFYH